MSAMSEKALPIIKQRLNRLKGDSSLDDYLGPVTESAELELIRKGIHLVDDADDLLLLVDYSTWRYQNRDQPGAMPQWLSTRLRERWLSSKGRSL